VNGSARDRNERPGDEASRAISFLFPSVLGLPAQF